MNRTRFWAVAFVFLLLSFFGANAVVNVSAETGASVDSPLIGAYYYIWYGLNTSIRNMAGKFHSNWENATSTPLMGEYVSNDSTIADTQITLAKLHDIDFFAVSWLGIFNWYDHLAVNDFLQQGLLKAEHINTFNFCILYESDIILNSVYTKQTNGGLNGMSATAFFESVFVNDTNYAAQNYFNNPSYLRIDGKPVLFIYDLPYLCRNLSTSAVHSMLEDLRNRLSNDVYLVGEVGHGPAPANITSFRLSDFSDVLNATTNYFFSSPKEVWDGILNEAEKYFPTWPQNMSALGMSFFPSAYPGYNDTKENSSSSVLPLNATAFGQFLQIAQKNTGNRGIMMITSWNEWKESTAVEPSLENGEMLLDTITELPPPAGTEPMIYFVAGILIGIVAGAVPVGIYFSRRRRK
jgi:hypothetical protein